MLPLNYICSGCRETFNFPFRYACYLVGAGDVGASIPEDRLLPVLVRPAWCKDCDNMCIAEDILPLRAFEDAYGAARRGVVVEYPVETTFMDSTMATNAIEPYLRWRMERRHAARALCCGGTNY